MSHTYTSRIDVSEQGEWQTVAVSVDNVIDERSAADVVRAVLEDWVVDRPAAGGRIVVYDAGDYSRLPLDESARVRVSVFPGEGDMSLEPGAVGYLLVDPSVEDPHGWVNP